MIKTYKNFLIALALLPCFAHAQQGALVDIRILETDPPPGAVLHANEPMYLRLQYETDSPVRFQVMGYLNGAKLEQQASLNPAPVYPAGSGETLARISYSAKTDIDELRVIAFDEGWQSIHEIPLAIEMHWSGRPSKMWRQPAEWVRQLNAQQQSIIPEGSAEQAPAPAAAESAAPAAAASAAETAQEAPHSHPSPLLWVLPLIAAAVILVIVLRIKKSK